MDIVLSPHLLTDRLMYAYVSTPLLSGGASGQ